MSDNPLGIERIEVDDIDERIEEPDPNHPGRPKHDDFKRMSKVIVGMDNAVEDGGAQELVGIVSDEVDFRSLEYMSRQRLARLIAVMNMANVSLDEGNEMLSWFYREAFIAGIKFERMRREGEEA